MKRQSEDSDIITNDGNKKLKVSEIVNSMPLTLHSDRELSSFIGKKFYEPVDIGRFKNLLQCGAEIFQKDTLQREKPQWQMWFDSKRAHLAAVVENYDSTSKSIVVNYQSSNGGSSQWGRVYPKQGASAGEISGELRSWLLYGTWTALDIANCHPNIVYQVLKAHGCTLPSLELYCVDRDKCLEDVMETYSVGRNASKMLFIRILYGGLFEAWAKEYGCPVDVEPTKFINGFAEDTAKAAQIIVESNPSIKATMAPNQRSLKKQKRSPGRPRKVAPEDVRSDTTKYEPSEDQIVSAWCSEIERRCLRLMYDYLVEQQLIEDAKPESMLRYDGIDLPLARLEGADKEQLMRGMEQCILKNTNLALRITEKAYELPGIAVEIERQLDFASRIPSQCKEKLDLDTLIALKSYPAQKWYFEQFVSLIFHSGDYVWTQRRYLDCENEVEGTQSIPYDNCMRKTRKDMHLSFDHVPTLRPGDEHPKIFIDVWMKDSERRSCDDVDFLPFNSDLEDSPGEDRKLYNLFKGFCLPKNQSDCDPYIFTRCFHYIGLQLCENNPVAYQFFWNSIVKLFKEPRKRLEQAFAFQGKAQGTGFDVYMNTIGMLLGSNHFTNTAKVQDILGDHAEGLEHRLLVVMNELKFENIRGSEDEIKALITCKKHTVNPKCVRPYSINLFALLVFGSNHQNAISMDVDDNERRINVFKPSNLTLGSKLLDKNWGYGPEDWEYLAALFKTPQFLSALYKDIMNTDISGFDPRRFRPLILGREYFRASEHNSALHAKFFAHMLRSGKFKCFASESPAGDFFEPSERTSDELPSFIPIEVGLKGVTVEVPASDLQQLFKNWMDEDKSVSNARGDSLGWRNLCSGNGLYSNVIKLHKRSSNFFQFNTSKLWYLLLHQKWVIEAFDYHTQTKTQGELRKEFHVDECFKKLSTLMDETPLGERSQMNPGKDRPIQDILSTK